MNEILFLILGLKALVNDKTLAVVPGVVLVYNINKTLAVVPGVALVYNIIHTYLFPCSRNLKKFQKDFVISGVTNFSLDIKTYTGCPAKHDSW